MRRSTLSSTTSLPPISGPPSPLWKGWWKDHEETERRGDSGRPGADVRIRRDIAAEPCRRSGSIPPGGGPGGGEQPVPGQSQLCYRPAPWLRRAGHGGGRYVWGRRSRLPV